MLNVLVTCRYIATQLDRGHVNVSCYIPVGYIISVRCVTTLLLLLFAAYYVADVFRFR